VGRQFQFDAFNDLNKTIKITSLPIFLIVAEFFYKEMDCLWQIHIEQL